MISNYLKSHIVSLQIIICLTSIIYLGIYWYTYRNVWQRNDLKKSDKSGLDSNGIHQWNETNYLVWSRNCRILRLDPFEPDVMAIFKPKPPTQCSRDDTILVHKIFNWQTKRYQLHMNEMENYNLSNFNCCYKEILRGNNDDPDNSYRLLPCLPFEQDYEVPTYINYIIVECYAVKTRQMIFKDAHFFIQENFNGPTRPVNGSNINRNGSPFGILMFGIDSMSQFNLRRTMPKTFQYLQQTNWFELSGYNKIGDNTFPNLMAILEGIDMDHSYKLCKLHEVGGVDNCTVTWKLFKEMGYITAYAEDQNMLSTFSYWRKGFKNPPTDYYLRPFTMAIEEHLPVQYKWVTTKYCIGNKQAAEYVYDFGLEFAERFLKQRTFGLFWSSSFSHEDFSQPSAMDTKMLSYLKQLQNKNVLEHSIVIFFSDHGARYGDLRHLRSGFLEERMPMFFISLPETFKQQHPFYTNALRKNAQRLISPYDIHMTLKHLMTLSVGIPNNLTQAISCPTCHTIFKPIVEDRTCAQAGIVNNWCPCIPYFVIPTYTKLIKNIACLIIEEMNKYIQRRKSGSSCSELTFKSVIEAFTSDISNGSIPHRIRYDVHPEGAEFEAQFYYSQLTQAMGMDVSGISRLDSYANHSKCIDDVLLKKFCICKNIT